MSMPDNKACNYGGFCMFRMVVLDGHGCNYYSYCNYQTLRDSQKEDKDKDKSKE